MPQLAQIHNRLLEMHGTWAKVKRPNTLLMLADVCWALGLEIEFKMVDPLPEPEPDAGAARAAGEDGR